MVSRIAAAAAAAAAVARYYCYGGEKDGRSAARSTMRSDIAIINTRRRSLKGSSEPI